jgi:enoyl-CoA hydratase/carnithine racemase
MPIHHDVTDGVATITIDNPPVNAFTPALHKDLFSVLSEFLVDRNTRVGILTASGTRAFCAGDDIKTPRPERSVEEIVSRHLHPKNPEDVPEYPGWEAEVRRLSEERFKPIIAAVNGPAMGQGLIYLLQLSDLRIATPNARFGLPEIAYGMGGATGVVRLGRHLPPTVALWLALTGEPLNAQEALKHNLINEIVEHDRLLMRAREVATKIARHPPIAVRVEMEAFYRGLDMTREQSAAFTAHLYRLQRAAMGPKLPFADK